ncbi:MAG: hypothetical protein EOP36_10280 [Rubrivivax sp.]|nr:MAG: hypothetical protein EOP36_10280 [Rubrivivax sp.]
MTRLPSELHRLYHPLIDADGRVRAMVLSILGRPADWDALSLVWRAVQSELDWPAPAIAVSGTDGYQLWFSLEEAAPLEEVHAFFAALRDRYLNHLAPTRIGIAPAMDSGASQTSGHADLVPGREVLAGQWSAFVAPDLAPIFAETPWLDIPPSPEGQAELLSRLQRIKPAAWQLALAKWRPAPEVPGPASAPASPPAAGMHLDPRRFLLDVMSDETVALALRIEAAKALLPRTRHGG